MNNQISDDRLKQIAEAGSQITDYQRETSGIYWPEALEMAQELLERRQSGTREYERGRQSGIEEALKHVNAIKQSAAIARERSKEAGRVLVSECRQSDVETCERIEERISSLAAKQEPKEDLAVLAALRTIQDWVCGKSDGRRETLAKDVVAAVDRARNPQ